ncbi:MAG: exo-alpha-sialidase [Bradymonadales bacterium]|nr:exo-alpha-sialidase [Bradymonadales bacterium]
MLTLTVTLAVTDTLAGGLAQGMLGDPTDRQPANDWSQGERSQAEPTTPVGLVSPFSLEQRFLIHQGSGHLAFPDITRLSDGRLFLVYRQGAGHAEDSGRIMRQIGSPDGLTWSEPEVLLDTPDIDDRDPSVTTLADGVLILNFFQYRRVTVGERTLVLHQVFAARSTDGGASFSPPVQVTRGPMEVEGARIDAGGQWVDAAGLPIPVSASTSPAVELEGELVIPTYGGHALNLADLAQAPRSVLSFSVSADGGSSFVERPLALENPGRLWFMEPALLQTPDGELLLQARTSAADSPGGGGPMVQLRLAGDTGTWSSWEPLGFIGHAPYLLRLESGLILSAFREVNDEYTRESVSFMASRDGGVSWSSRLLVEDCGESECGYPSLVELGAGRFLVVYYADGGGAIKGAIYRPEPAGQ